MSRPRNVGAAFFLAGACFCVAALFDEKSRTLYIGIGASQWAVGSSQWGIGAAILSIASRKADEGDDPSSSH